MIAFVIFTLIGWALFLLCEPKKRDGKGPMIWKSGREAHEEFVSYATGRDHEDYLKECEDREKQFEKDKDEGRVTAFTWCDVKREFIEIDKD